MLRWYEITLSRFPKVTPGYLSSSTINISDSQLILETLSQSVVQFCFLEYIQKKILNP